MGGCRCTYRNCTVRTDGTTHMFHYPVFDKHRCHQWLTNAQKHEFLNLKVSQLKNRVVCQYHFKDEDFMNFKKDKLKFDAIPTLNGPYCDPTPYSDNTISQDDGKIYPISVDDIETEYLTLSDKKANFSVKYGDFLTNSDVMGMNALSNSSNNNSKTQVVIQNKHEKCLNAEEPFVINLSDNANKFQNSTTINILPNESTIVTGDNKSQLGDLNPVTFIFEPVEAGFAEVKSKPNNTGEKISENNNNNVTQQLIQDKSFSFQTKSESPRKQRVKILSQKKISEPVSLIGNFEPVSPSIILCLPDKRNKINSLNGTELNVKNENKEPSVNILNNNTLNISPSNKVTIVVNEQQLNKTRVQASQKVIKNTIKTSNKSLLKPKINQDRVTAIEEKRKFNMKLRDIIESCLDKIDDPDNGQMRNESNIKKEQVGTFLSKDTALPNMHEYTIACLEARMKRMEDILLNKIDQNTQRIMELKSSILTSDKKSTCTQTTSNEESHKKQLYKEISKYLSANANSLIYEELFINKYAQSTSQNIPSPKRRRRR